jgi:hypothetical protein
MTKTSWMMVSLLGFIVGSLGGFVLMQANRAAAGVSIEVGMMGGEIVHRDNGYGILHITYNQASLYQAGGVAAAALGVFLALVGLVRMAQAK